MSSQTSFNDLLGSLQEATQYFPDKRTGKNCSYSIEDISLGAFSVFFTQSPSFLAHQKLMHESEEKNNAETLFKIKAIPSDNHIRNILDEVSPKFLKPVFEKIFLELQQADQLETYRSYKKNLLIALDGTWYYQSKNIHCDQCSTKKHRDGSITYHHIAITPVIVAPGNNKVISLPPEFIVPQDGHSKQDCENAAAKRWLNESGPQYSKLGTTILGDDLYCKQSLCDLILKKGFHFILVCKPNSHKTLYEWVEMMEKGKDLKVIQQRYWTGKERELHTYRYVNQVPLRDSEDTLKVNWCELTIQKEDGSIIFRNAFATDFHITERNVASIIKDGRARWKIENENNNNLKTKGYNLEHNFGHGEKNLSSLLMTLNVLAYLFHTVLELCDENYRLLRAKLPTRKTFFDHIRALTQYLVFEDWSSLLSFMIEGLKKRHKLNSS